MSPSRGSCSRDAAGHVRRPDDDRVAVVIGAAWSPTSPESRSIVWSISSLRSTMPFRRSQGSPAGLRVEPDHLVAGRWTYTIRSPRGRRSSRPARVPTACGRGLAALAFVFAVHSTAVLRSRHRRDPRAAARTGCRVQVRPFTIKRRGCKLNSGRGPSASVLKRQATSMVLELFAVESVRTAGTESASGEIRRRRSSIRRRAGEPGPPARRQARQRNHEARAGKCDRRNVGSIRSSRTCGIGRIIARVRRRRQPGGGGRLSRGWPRAGRGQERRSNGSSRYP